jgi:hypothetical protein
MSQIRIPYLKLIQVKSPLNGIKGSGVPVKGVLELPVMIGIPPRCTSLQQHFIMIDMTLAYNAILGRPLLHQINVVINTRYLALKFPTQYGVATLRGD